MKPTPRTSVRELLLSRQGLVFVSSETPQREPCSDAQLCAIELELAQLGYVLSSRLRARLSLTTLDELVLFHQWALDALQAHLGADQKHQPLFRKFPEGVPSDTAELWWAKVLVHFLQSEGQPCLFCRKLETTHVLNPCRHVVCDACFDGSNYSACPVCEHHTEQQSPFFLPAPARESLSEHTTFKLIDLGESFIDSSQSLFVSLCERKQSLSPADRDALTTLVSELGTKTLPWLPAKIPVRENIATVFATLFKTRDPSEILPHARRFITTATDVLRFIAVLSDTDGSLLRNTTFKTVEISDPQSPIATRFAGFLNKLPPTLKRKTVTVPVQVSRFKTAKLSRPLRRALLSLLDGLDPDGLVEDMLRHRSYWVWVGEFLHPHEYASRFANTARAFAIVRKHSPDGTPAPRFKTWRAKLEDTIAQRDFSTTVSLLSERPGELARSLDRALRIATDHDSREAVIKVFKDNLQHFSTPVLVTLRSHLGTRATKSSVRIFWPKGRIATGVSRPDTRTPLDPQTIETTLRAIDGELLRRFSEKPLYTDGFIDKGLDTIPLPFNERTASRAAVTLPRGAQIKVCPDKVVRLFLHWCEPEKNNTATDLDLSVSLYDPSWNHLGVCAYYQLQTLSPKGSVIARSSGDLRNAPWPDGATEFIDLDRAQALDAGVRYAVMVVNCYAGLTHSLLARSFAGVMFRAHPEGEHFDPRAVELKFTLDGEHGIYLPLVFDLHENTLHWLDVYSKGQLAMNNVETSRRAITTVCPELMAYFDSGARATVYDLGLMHLAARCQRVFIRGETTAQYLRTPDETVENFYNRLTREEANEPRSQPLRSDGPPALAQLYRGDLDLPENSLVYALFREKITPTLNASDLLS